MQGRCFHAVGDIVWAYSLGMTIQNMSMAMSMWWLSRFLMAQVTLDQFYWIQALIHLFLHWNLQDQGQASSAAKMKLHDAQGREIPVICMRI